MFSFYSISAEVASFRCPGQPQFATLKRTPGSSSRTPSFVNDTFKVGINRVEVQGSLFIVPTATVDITVLLLNASFLPYGFQALSANSSYHEDNGCVSISLEQSIDASFGLRTEARHDYCLFLRFVFPFVRRQCGFIAASQPRVAGLQVCISEKLHRSPFPCRGLLPGPEIHGEGAQTRYGGR